MRILSEFKERVELIYALADLIAAAMLIGYVLTKLAQWLSERRPRTV